MLDRFLTRQLSTEDRLCVVNTDVFPCSDAWNGNRLITALCYRLCVQRGLMWARIVAQLGGTDRNARRNYRQ